MDSRLATGKDAKSLSTWVLFFKISHTACKFIIIDLNDLRLGINVDDQLWLCLNPIPIPNCNPRANPSPCPNPNPNRPTYK